MSDEMSMMMDVATLGAFDLTDVTAMQRGPLPRGQYKFVIKEAELTVNDTADGDAQFAKADFKLEVVEVMALKPEVDEEGNPYDASQYEARPMRHDMYLGKTTEEVAAALGYVKAFIENITGASASGSLNDLLEACAGREFVGVVTHRVDKNDRSRVYTGISEDKKDLAPA